jgi:hypothetical protein
MSLEGKPWWRTSFASQKGLWPTLHHLPKVTFDPCHIISHGTEVR